ncbi:unnamed protein product [Cyclocybe aegerita]|uniref:Uncharacterized protein n=1 Tax=Cyclocybe aegerita TaxID=1973307 RepID=A0A8S0VU98_CYCAE|nr:unnamed protein product [Cyclocybe aegerita]
MFSAGNTDVGPELSSTNRMRSRDKDDVSLLLSALMSSSLPSYIYTVAFALLALLNDLESTCAYPPSASATSLPTHPIPSAPHHLPALAIATTHSFPLPFPSPVHLSIRRPSTSPPPLSQASNAQMYISVHAPIDKIYYPGSHCS